MGDPAGIGPEVIAKALAGARVRRLCRPLVIGSFPVMQHMVKSLKLKMSVIRVEGHDVVSSRSNYLAVLDPLDCPLGRFPRGVAAPETGAASVLFIKKAVELAQLGCIDGIVTAPINKEAINMAGCHFPGHTELLADLTKTQDLPPAFGQLRLRTWRWQQEAVRRAIVLPISVNGLRRSHDHLLHGQTLLNN